VDDLWELGVHQVMVVESLPNHGWKPQRKETQVRVLCQIAKEELARCKVVGSGLSQR